MTDNTTLDAPLTQAALDQLFYEARSQNGWQDRPVPPEMLEKLWEMASLGPTSANCEPGRFIFLTTPEAKERLRPHLSRGNTDKTMTAPVVVLAAFDTEFYEKLPQLFPHGDARSWFTSSPDLAHETAFRNGTLQAGYLLLATRALGLDAGPLSGFDADGVNAEFFAEGTWKVNFVINLGYGDPAKVWDRLPRLPFAEGCEVL
ncbi:malonic semialdehyde reductase [Paracoccus sp. 1_MG-2023]|uniref:malonic semialdehyde reductase n=1 Tax=unclassified Paracoccus (in: a-proteobacteria) TaxID=2688777 RepID=UPI001C09F257|nr:MULTISPECIES: malonic semialdehyde reductase [unclassified Paracoccus (in: a-proteobacteria)]MBU2956106.1 malonic semialdehyde reductase [Paracoccus sp. C2R09]MDO6668948.1 malonic semialdehyde reductase [Paracoccus sp. 1_MG-2023]